jgi:hypothetical protein
MKLLSSLFVANSACMKGQSHDKRDKILCNIREHQIDFDPQTADEDFDPYPEEKMCYFNVITLQPGDPSYLKAFLTRLPYISHYEVRISKE